MSIAARWDNTGGNVTVHFIDALPENMFAETTPLCGGGSKYVGTWTQVQGIVAPLVPCPDCFVDEWNDSRSGRIKIRLHRRISDWEVYALDGHNLLPRTKSFLVEADARRYANVLWETV